MTDRDKSKEELITELVELRQFVSKGPRKSEERYLNIIEAIEDGYYEVDPSGNNI